MIVYRDRTWCPFWETCPCPCDRALTMNVERAADKWWKGNEGPTPIAVYAEPPACHPDYEEPDA